ncbi:hypothetical protein [Cohnella sp.]|uniref:hypothetical protein n=1 Tax=Cohnella sp. TaxID=1883426 RepID=UPI003564457A
MRRSTIKLLVFAGIVAFAVLYGMELSSKGIEDVNGPWSTTSPATERGDTSENEEWTLPTQEPVQEERQSRATQSPVDDTPYYDWDEEEYGIPRDDRKPIVDRLSGKTAEVLHDLSRNGIKLVVSLFDRVTG